MSTVLVVAPHPDDEVLGCGGAILWHLSRGDAVHVVICTRGEPERFGAEQVARVQAEARECHTRLSVTQAHALDFPAARLDTVPGAELNAALLGVYREARADVIYLPHPGDVHRDHQLVFQAGMVAARPNGDATIEEVLAYETVSETDWYAAPLTPAFVPNVFLDITSLIERKLEACRAYASQIRPAPHQRSLESIRALSATRGHCVGVPYAEAFMMIRRVQR